MPSRFDPSRHLTAVDWKLNLGLFRQPFCLWSWQVNIPHFLSFFKCSLALAGVFVLVG